MIDIESTLFTEVHDVITTEFPTAFVSPYEVRIPAKLPCVGISEVSNMPFNRSMDSASTENHIRVEYEFNIYTRGDGKKTQARAICNTICDYMSSIGFVRGIMNPIELIEDESLYRLIVRFYGIVDKNYNLYRG